jgi:hypothetical protein
MVPKYFVIVDEIGPLKDWPFIDYFVADERHNLVYSYRKENAKHFDLVDAKTEANERSRLYGRKHRVERASK